MKNPFKAISCWWKSNKPSSPKWLPFLVWSCFADVCLEMTKKVERFYDYDKTKLTDGQQRVLDLSMSMCENSINESADYRRNYYFLIASCAAFAGMWFAREVNLDT
jgi:hypothetical protein